MMKGLKGAVINNIYLLWGKNFAIYLLVTAACFIGYLIAEAQIFLALGQLFLVVAIPVAVLEASLAAFSSRWNVFEKSFGISPLYLVLSRYIIFVCVSLLCAVIWMISPFYESHAPGAYQDFVFLLFWVQLTCILYFPIMYLMNPNKTSTGVAIMVVAVVIAAFLTGFVVFLSLNSMWAAISFIAALYVISACLSAFFDKINIGRAV